MAAQVQSKYLEPTKASKHSRHHTVVHKEEQRARRASLSISRGGQRQHRPSFQGLSIIDEGKRSGATSLDPASIGSMKIATMRANRRRKTLDVMKMTTQNAGIREMIDNTMGSVLKGLVVEGTPEQRLQAVLTKVKESGISAERIFSYFNGGNPNNLEITRESFLEAVERLGNCLIVLSDEELTRLVEKFDTDGDGKISLAEFKHYCYHQIPSVAWKAERQRLGRGQMEKLRAHSSRKFSGLTDDDDKIQCGPQVFRTTKLFWRTNTTVEIRLYYCKDLDMITMQIHDESNSKELSSVYVCKSRCEATISRDDGEKAGNKTSGAMHVPVRTEEEKSKSNEETNVDWGRLGKYLVARLKLRHASQCIIEDVDQSTTSAAVSGGVSADYVPFLCKLSGDDFNDSLVLPKPANLAPPPPISSAETTCCEKDFEQAVFSLQTATRRARTSRQSAQQITSVLTEALQEVMDE